MTSEDGAVYRRNRRHLRKAVDPVMNRVGQDDREPLAVMVQRHFH